MSELAPPWPELLQNFGWGQLQHHLSECSECDGTGHFDDGEECDQCEHGTLFWGSFYGDAVGECMVCKEDTFTNGRMYEDGYICLKCYLKAHKRVCGCSLFVEAEKAAGV